MINFTDVGRQLIGVGANDLRALSANELRDRQIAQLDAMRNYQSTPADWARLQNYRPPIMPAPAGWKNWYAIGDELA